MDYGARFYNAQIGRWHSVDAMAGKFYPVTLYNYTFNNPIVLTDPAGNCPVCPVLWHGLRWLATRGLVLFAGGAAISGTAQFTTNYMLSQDVNKAVKNIDLVDVAMSGF